MVTFTGEEHVTDVGHVVLRCIECDTVLLSELYVTTLDRLDAAWAQHLSDQ